MFPIIDQVIKSNLIYRFQNELNAVEQSDEIDIERHQILKKIIDTLGQQKNKHDVKQEKLNTHVAILKEKPFQKKWHFLSDLQKLDRLNLYLESIQMDDNKKKRYIDYYKKNGIASKEVRYNNLTAKIEELIIKEEKLYDQNDQEKEIKIKKVANKKTEKN